MSSRSGIQNEHGCNLPTIRLAKITLNNFKSVKHGEVTFQCGRKHIPYGTQSDILGLYGQNGSGKSSLIEAISILKLLLTGRRISDKYTDCISVDSDYAELSFAFDFQYPVGTGYPTNNDIRKVVYSVKLARRIKDEDEEEETLHIYTDDKLNKTLQPGSNFKIRVFDEVLKCSGSICGENGDLKPFFDTSKPGMIISPATKAKVLIGELTEDKRIALGVNKSLAEKESHSFIFMRKMFSLYEEFSDYSVYYQMLLELQHYGKFYLYVAETKMTAISNMGTVLPFFKPGGMEILPIGCRFPVRKEAFGDMQNYFENLSLVLSQIVPGLSIGIKNHGGIIADNGAEAYSVSLISTRGEKEIPLAGESDGVKKLVSTLYYLIVAYSQQSVTVAYDEFDSGIFEYLLGEILQVMQASGKGQFIFTSHNMRPLEVLKKEFVWFTTTDENNRYIRLTGLAGSNNLRKVYYREIAMHEHYDNLYNETQQSQIVTALRKAGGNF